MLKNEKVPTAGQLSDLIGDLVKMITKIVSGLTAESVQRLIGRKKEIAEEIEGILLYLSKSNREKYLEWIWRWEKFYGNVMRVTNVDFSNLLIPDKPNDGKYWLLVVIPGITLESLICKLKPYFSVHFDNDGEWDEDEISLEYEERDAQNGPYAIWVQAINEADEGTFYYTNRDEEEEELSLKSESVHDFYGKAITLVERLLLEGEHYTRGSSSCVDIPSRNTHLDLHSFTMCAGARFVNGKVPAVAWDNRLNRLSISEVDEDYADDYHCVRRVVS